jgi:hypothetical protein
VAERDQLRVELGRLGATFRDRQQLVDEQVGKGECVYHTHTHTCTCTCTNTGTHASMHMHACTHTLGRV